MADLTPYVPRFLLEWERRYGDTRHQAVEGSLVFADVSGFTRLSERLARAGGKVGAEQMTDVINSLFGDLLMVAARRGGEMLKYGGDALLLLFLGEHHAAQAAAACHEMQARLRVIGRVETGAGPVRLRMSVGVHSGSFDMFRVGASHTELVVAGPAATTTCAMEAAADAGEVLLSSATVALLDPRVLGAPKADGRLLRRCPDAPSIDPEPLARQAHAVRFLSPAIAAHLSDGRVEPAHRRVTIAFLHLMGIDERLAAGQDPLEVATALHDTMATIQDALHELEVTFLATDVIADGTKVMASAGAPGAVESGDDRTVRALVRIRDACTPLAVRAGAHQGHVFAGDVGPTFRRTFTTIGDVTNTAARVMGRATAGQVLVLRSVLDHVRSCVAIEQPSFLAKGKAEPLVPFLVDRIGDHDIAVTETQAPLPFVGRDAALGALDRAAAAAREGRGAALEVVGDAGIGKTRLLQELAAPGMRRVTVRCEPYARVTPYFAIRHLVQPALGAIRTSEDLRRALVGLAPDQVAWLPLLAAVFDVPADETPETAALEPQFRARRTSLLVEELLDRALDGPALLIIEDVHWLDEASAEVLRHLELVGGRHPWLLVATRRPIDAPFHPDATVRLDPLTDDEVRTLVRRTMVERPLPPPRVEALVSRAGGNPLFLGGMLLAGDDDDLPASIEALIAAGIDALDAAGRRLVRTAAVLGSTFDPSLLPAVDEELVGLDQAPHITRRLGAFVEPEQDGRLRFRHQLVRQVAYEALPYRLRRELHRRAGEALEAVDDGGSPDLLALHFHRAEEHAKAWRYGVDAARRAIEKSANADAVALLRQALEAARFVPDVSDRARAEAWEELGDAANLATTLDEARHAYGRARRLRRNGDAVAYARLCRKEARLAERAGSRRAALRWLRDGVRALEGDTSRRAIAVRADLWAAHSWLRRQAGRPEDARRWAQRAIEDGRRARDSLTVAHGYVLLDGAEIALGRPGKATHGTRALRIFEGRNALGDQAVVLNNLGAHAYHLGRWDEAVRLYGRGRETNVKIGNLVDAGYGSWNIAEILMDQGRVDDAVAELTWLGDLWRSVGYSFGDALVDWQRGRIEARWGDPAAGLDLLRPVRDRLESMGLAPYVIGVDTAIAECLLRRGDHEEALGVVEDALAGDGAAGGTPCAPSLLRLRGYAWAAAGRVGDAWAAFDESLHEARTRQAPFDVALALEGFAVLVEMGSPDREADDERLALLRGLGVLASPPPPLVGTAAATVG